MRHILGIDIGGTKCAVILGRVCSSNITMEILDKIIFPTGVQKTSGYTLDKITESLENILNKNCIGINEVEGIGISCGGPLDSKMGIIMSPPNLYGWDNVHITEIFENRFGVRTKLLNDANACALAEWKFGAARGCRNVIFLTFGTGMGAGLILDGRLYSGTNDMAGEAGHIRLDVNGPVGYGKSGSFEGFCSGGGIAQLARAKALEKLQMGEKVSFCDGIDKLGEINARTVGNAAESGDELAREIYRTSGFYLGKGLSILIDILNPEIIVIGSIFARSRELLWNAAAEILDRECLSRSLKECRIVPAALGENIGDYAALAAALY